MSIICASRHLTPAPSETACSRLPRHLPEIYLVRHSTQHAHSHDRVWMGFLLSCKICFICSRDAHLALLPVCDGPLPDAILVDNCLDGNLDCAAQSMIRNCAQSKPSRRHRGSEFQREQTQHMLILICATRKMQAIKAVCPDCKACPCPQKEDPQDPKATGRSRSRNAPSRS